MPREVAVRRLLGLEAEDRLASADVRLVAEGLQVSERTVWRWLGQARTTGRLQSAERDRFVVTEQLRQRLAFWRGNLAAVRRELLAAEAAGGAPAPSKTTLRRAVQRDVPRGQLAGLRRGEAARRAHDVFLQRPATYRNEAWEADHVEAPVEVDVEGRLVKPWVTWFVDANTNAVAGAAVTPGPPSRESILVALRAAIALHEPYGPPGGLPERIRVDRGKDFLSSTVASVLAGLAVQVVDLPAYTPHLKGTVETLNGAAEVMFFAGLPRYTNAQKLTNRRGADPDAPPLRFEAFVAELLAWIRWWNGDPANPLVSEQGAHTMPVLEGRTPLQAWLGDPTPVTRIEAEDLRLLMLEDDGRTRKITTKGVTWRRRQYVGAWMTGEVGREVRIRYMPHHEHEVEVFDATTAAHLGAAVLADQATAEQIAELRQAREAHRRRLQADLRAAERNRRTRYAATTTAAPAQPLHAVTTEQAAAEQADLDHRQLGAYLHGQTQDGSGRDRPATVESGPSTGRAANVVPLRRHPLPIPAHWVLPLDHPDRQPDRQPDGRQPDRHLDRDPDGEQRESGA